MRQTLLSALGLFVYQTLDNIDGKQVKRTGLQEQTGEFMDHGCDSVSIGRKSVENY